MSEFSEAMNNTSLSLPDVAVVTQGATLDELTHNLREAIGLALEGEDLAELGLAEHPTIVATMEIDA